MFGVVQRSALHINALQANDEEGQIAEIIETVTFNDISQTKCINEFKYDAVGDFFSFSIMLGECDMNASVASNNETEYMKFSGNNKFKKG